MSSFPLDYGSFENIGDNYTLQLLPITNVTAFNTFSDETANEIPGPDADPSSKSWNINITGTGAMQVVDTTSGKTIGYSNWDTDLATTVDKLIISINTNTPNGTPFNLSFPFDNSMGYTATSTAAFFGYSKKINIFPPSGSGEAFNGHIVAIYVNGGTWQFADASGTPIVGAGAPQTYSGGVSSRLFQKQFRYSKNGGSYTSWATLNNTALQGITSVTTDVWLLEIKYTRIGTNTEGSIRWIRFILDNVSVLPCVMLRLSQTVYNTVYGSNAKYSQIVNEIGKFSDWSLTNYGFPVYLVDDATINDQMIYLDRTGSCSNIDMNVIMKSPWGKKFTDVFVKMNINLFSGIRS